MRELDRQEKVLAAIIGGATLEEAAAIAGYAGKQGAAKARDTALGARAEAVADLADEYRKQSEERLAIAVKAIMPAVKKGSLFAVDRLVKLEARWSKLRGGDAPARTEHSGPNGGPIDVKGVQDEILARIALLAASGGAREPDPEPGTEGIGGPPG